ncbi:MAG: L,D-transpeptidase family protein [Caldicoprobacterales bacterium]
MAGRQWLKQLQAVAYILLIVFLYMVLDGNIMNLSGFYQPDSSMAEVFFTQPGNKVPGQETEQEEEENEYDIFIDLTESMLYLFENGKMIKKYPVAQGKPGSPSPVGVWRIVSKARNWGSGFGTRWMGLDVPWGRYGIHGTNRPGSIGYRASAGCFRMRNKDVEELYSLVPYKTKVVVYGGPFGNMAGSFSRLAPGDRTSQVLEVQKRLSRLGYYEGALDGIYGEGMKAALIKFKKDNQLPLNHYVDWETYKALGILEFE